MPVHSAADAHTTVVYIPCGFDHVVVHDVKIDHSVFQRSAERLEFLRRLLRMQPALKITDRIIQPGFTDALSDRRYIGQPFHIAVKLCERPVIRLRFGKHRQFLREKRALASEREIEQIEDRDAADCQIPDGKPHDVVCKTRPGNAE